MTVTENQSIFERWEHATYIDPSLRINARMIAKLLGKKISATPFSRSKLFSKMLVCEPSLYTRFPIWIDDADSKLRLNETTILNEIRSGFSATKRARVRNTRSIEYLSIPKIVNKWINRKATFGVPDLHYINTRFDRRVKTSALNEFNLLPRGPYAFQSQDSLVISSSEAFTDSHSDDHSGSNHCFVGEKLWLMWDTIEGFDHGLEDVERSKVVDRAEFSMQEFLCMNSSRWLIIESGQTMFIPANMTHKVITLESYLGLGSFHAGFPSIIDSLLHWAELPPLWADKSVSHQECSVEYLIRRVMRRLQALSKADHFERARWGIPYFRMRLEQFQTTREFRSPLSEDAKIQTFIRAIQKLQ